jgi:hypothetical protein
VDDAGLDQKINKLLPDYMTMGTQGMGEMMDMAVPENSIPMVGGQGPFGMIDMGGMFTVVKVREGITSYEDPGWYEHPAGTLVRDPTTAELDALADIPAAAPPTTKTKAAEPARNPETVPATQGSTGSDTLYTCRMHPEVVSNKPGKCPKCGMKLMPKR